MIGIDRFYLHIFVGAKVNEIGEVLSKISIKHKIFNLIIFTLLKIG